MGAYKKGNKIEKTGIWNTSDEERCYRKEFQTPLFVIKYMVSLVPNRAVTVLEPTPGIGNMVHELNGGGIR